VIHRFALGLISQTISRKFQEINFSPRSVNINNSTPELFDNYIISIRRYFCANECG